MKEQRRTGSADAETSLASTFTVRDLLAIGFRHQRLVVFSFVAVCALTVAFVLVRPVRYEAQMKILVKRERVDPMVTPEETAQRPVMFGVTEEELNSEVELLKSRDLLTQVAIDVGLHQKRDRGVTARVRKVLFGDAEGSSGEDARIVAAAQQVARRMEVQPLRRSNVIQVNYASPDPALSSAVLTRLAERYLEKHLRVHRPSGAFDFFDRETERYASQLALAQARLDEQNQAAGVVSVQTQRQQALERLDEFEASEQATRAQIADTASRIDVLEKQMAATPERRTTQLRHASAALLQELNSTLVTHELKRIELLRTFQPGYPLVQEVDAQIASVRSAIASAKQSPLVEETTDRNPTYDSLVAELATNRSVLTGLRARANVAAASVAVYRDRARQLEELARSQQTLVRAATQSEQNYLIYLRKREEARISNALDAQRILNVAIAEQATVPLEPSGPPRTLLLLLGLGFAAFVSVGLACAAEYRDPSFRTPDEVEAFLGSPALASIPRNAA